jgi:hypothetical protein
MDAWPDRIPDGIEPLVGYRMWLYTVRHGRAKLHSLNCRGLRRGRRKCPWERAGSSWAVASCVGPGEGLHVAPTEDCDCGLYAMSTLRRLLAEIVHPSLLGPSPAVEDGNGEGTVQGRVELGRSSSTSTDIERSELESWNSSRSRGRRGMPCTSRHSWNSRSGIPSLFPRSKRLHSHRR